MPLHHKRAVYFALLDKPLLPEQQGLQLLKPMCIRENSLTIALLPLYVARGIGLYKGSDILLDKLRHNARLGCKKMRQHAKLYALLCLASKRKLRREILLIVSKHLLLPLLFGIGQTFSYHGMQYLLTDLS